MNTFSPLRPLRGSEDTLLCVHETLSALLNGLLPQPIYHLASFEPGTGKTEALCQFLSSWKARGFLPSQGALVVLATHKEITKCIERAGLDAADFAVIVAQGLPMNRLGSGAPETAPVLFTTQEKLRRLCEGQTFAAVSDLHFQGGPRRLRVWDEAFLPATPDIIRKDTILHPLEQLRPIHPGAAASLEALGDSLSADRAGEAVGVPHDIKGVVQPLEGLYGRIGAERWRPLASLSGLPAAVVSDGSRGLHLAGAYRHLPADFAPALVLDASGRVRETYRTMEANRTLRRLPTAASSQASYRRLRIHHWDRAASPSTLKEPEERREVLRAAAEAINRSADDGEPWLVIHPKARETKDGKGNYDIFEELRRLIPRKPERLSSVHWGDHHGTNDYKHVRKVMVLGLWRFPQPTYAALHIASGGAIEDSADPTVIEALKAGEHRHHLLQAVCRASVRNWGPDGVCGDCEVYLVDRLGNAGGEMLRETFPGAQISSWLPVIEKPRGAVHKVAQLLQEAFAVPGTVKVRKQDLRRVLGYSSTEALAKVTRRADFKGYVTAKGWKVTARSFELAL